VNWPGQDPGDGADGAGPISIAEPGTGARPRGAAESPGETRSPARGRSPWRTAFFGLAVVGLVAGIAWALLGSKLLVVRSVVITGTHLVPASQVRAAAAIGTGVPMIRVDTGAAASRVEAITQVQSAQVSKSWPDRIVITVRERTPVLAVMGPASGSGAGQFALIDAAGVVVRSVPVKPAGMPAYGTSAALAALRGSPSVAAAVTVLHEVPAWIARAAVTVTASSPQNVTLGLSNGVTIVWGSTARASAKTAEIYALMPTGAHYYDVSASGTAVTR
jgi:cell division protein FtsQ